jgi:carbon-monoxide dehydrogenase medium subunit
MPTLLPRFTIDQPKSLSEASEMLRMYGDDARAYAGGTELLLAMKQGGLRYSHLVDLKTIPGLASIEPFDGGIKIGALATHLGIERSTMVRERIPILAEMEHRVANVRVRATGTLGGNLCFGEPHSDPATLLLCLDARLHTTRRSLTPAEFLVGSFETALRPDELLESITIASLRASQRAAYEKFLVHEYPLFSLALVVDMEADEVKEARVAVGSVSPTPRRSAAAEELLLKTRVTEAADALADDAELIDDREASADYKRQLIHVFLERAWTRALETTA